MAGLRTAGLPSVDAAPAQVGVLLELSGNGVHDELVPRLSDREGITEATLLRGEADRRTPPHRRHMPVNM